MRDVLQWIEAVVRELSLAQAIGLGLTAAVTLGLLILVRRGMPRMCRRWFEAVDERIPAADLSAFTDLTARLLAWACALIVMFAAGLTGAVIIGLDTSSVTGAMWSMVSDAARAAAPVAVRLGILALIAGIAIRAMRATIPRAIKRGLARRGTSRRHDDEEIRKRADTVANVVNRVCTGVVLVIAGFVGLSELGFDIGPMLAGAGVAGIAIGFGAQNLVRDYLSGMFIVMEDQYSIDDIVTISGITGKVEELNLRRTIIRDLDKTAHTIPNGEIRSTSNFTKDYAQVHLDVSVAYKENLDEVIEIIERVGTAMYDDGCCEGAMREPIYVKRVDRFGDSGIAIKVLGLTDPGDQWAVAGEFRTRLKSAFDDAGVEIPFPHRTVYWGDASPPVEVAGGTEKANAA